MEKNGKESESCNDRSNFFLKAFLLVLTVVIVVQFIVIGKGFASLNAKIRSVDEEKTWAIKSLRNDATKSGTRRSKRGTDETAIKKALLKLDKLEER